MNFMKSAAVVLALSLSLATSGGAVSAGIGPLADSTQSEATVSFVFGGCSGVVLATAAPGSFFAVNCPGPFGIPVTLACGGIGQSGVDLRAFGLPPGLDVTTITVAMVSPGLAPMLFVYNSDLDRWILD